jgi:glycerophosphoryl diester phosphodiesterase
MRLSKDCWLLNNPIAHRGLWGGDIIENSITAYKNACDKGYPIEIDVYLTTDNKIVSFHDTNLKRMTGVDANITDKTLLELKQLSLLNSNEKIPTLEEILSICENKSPLLIEIKNQKNGYACVEELVKLLKNYKGEFAIQSFNPFYIKKVKELAPDFIRGILGTNKKESKKWTENFAIKFMPFNFIIKPDFISYKYSALPLKKRKVKNKAVLAWTITDKNAYDSVKPYADNIIFEHFIPNK